MPQQYEEDEERKVRGKGMGTEEFIKRKDTIPYLLAQGEKRRKKEREITDLVKDTLKKKTIVRYATSREAVCFFLHR